MAVYKVPQDVEAEDKLIGPFSFRQFIYLIVAALGIFLAWALSRVFIGLIIIPLPIIVAMLALALPLRKDQPMETYLIAMIKFFFKPRKRLWQPEGNALLVEITAPRVADGPQLKEVGGEEASSRLEYLSQLVDTQGWASRGVDANSGMSDIFVADAAKAVDVLDDSNSLARSLDQRIAQADNDRLQAVKQQFQASMQQQNAAVPVQQPAQPQVYEPQVATLPAGAEAYSPEALLADIQPPASQPQQPIKPAATPVYNPYPAAIRQKVLHPTPEPELRTVSPPPTSVQPTEQPQAERAGGDTVSPDIIRLANDKDLSIRTMESEAKRLKKNDEQEVVIKLH